MHKFLIAATTAAAFITFGKSAPATDILSHDDVPHVLTITENGIERTVNLDALGEIQNICNGCTVALEDGQVVTATADNMIAIIEGLLTLDE